MEHIKGGFPAFNKNQEEKNGSCTFNEDLAVPENSQIIMFLHLSPKYYTINTQRILGTVKLKIKTL